MVWEEVHSLSSERFSDQLQKSSELLIAMYGGVNSRNSKNVQHFIAVRENGK